jgi:hypothetical protein
MERNPNACTVFLRGRCLEVGFDHGVSVRCSGKTSRLLKLFVSIARQCFNEVKDWLHCTVLPQGFANNRSQRCPMFSATIVLRTNWRIGGVSLMSWFSSLVGDFERNDPKPNRLVGQRMQDND